MPTVDEAEWQSRQLAHEVMSRPVEGAEEGVSPLGDWHRKSVVKYIHGPCALMIKSAAGICTWVAIPQTTSKAHAILLRIPEAMPAACRLYVNL